MKAAPIWILLVIFVFRLPLNAQTKSDVFFNPFLSRNFHESTYDSLRLLLVNFLKTKDSLFISRNETLFYNPYWDSSDIQLYRDPFFYFHGASLPLGIGDTTYKPVVLSISKERRYKDYMARIAYVSTCENERYYVRQINNVLIVHDEKAGYKLKHPIQVITNHWRKIKVGKINYICNPYKSFDFGDAKRMNGFNEKVAKYFHLPSCEFTYYSCGSYQDMWRVLGYDFNQEMYANGNKTGGYTLHYAKTIVSGNNKEYYPHELVHIYTNMLYSSEKFAAYDQYNRIIDEGLATFLGGSMEKDLSFHIKELKKFILKHQYRSIRDFIDINNAQPGTILDNNITDIYYAFGGLLVYLIDKKGGHNSVESALATISQSESYSYIANLYTIPLEKIETFIFDSLLEYDK